MSMPSLLAGRRVLNVMLASGRGGLETMAARYGRALAELGAETSNLGAPDGALAGLPGFRPFRVRFGGDPFAALAFRGPARRSDLILAHGNRAIDLTARPLARGSAKVVAVVHNFRFKPVVARADLALAVSGAVADALRAAHPALPVETVENWGPLSIGVVRDRLADPPRVASYGRLHANKGFDRLIEAAALLRGRGRPVRLALGGEGPERAALEALAARLEAPVEFRGWIEPPRFLAEADLFVLSSRVEPFGLVTAEAMAAGVPVVATDIDGPRAVLQQGRLGRLVEPDDARALADAIAAALDDPARAERARAARDHALATYGEAAGRARLAAALERLF
jgi:glycosyltransferase involved in cell wall biosynthesis